MRYFLFPALSLLCTYGMVGCAYWGFLYGDDPMKWVLYGTLPLTGVTAALCLVNIVCAVRACRGADWERALRLARLGMVWKLLAIPYNLLNFAAWTMVSAAFLVVPGLQVFLLGVPLAAIAAYVPLLTSSAYSVASIAAANRLGAAVKARHIVLELLFALDVLDSIWLYIHLRKSAKEMKIGEGD